MQKFTRMKAVAAPLPLANVDTDMIIPAQYMKSLTRTGLGKHLFRELRFVDDGSERGDFILNRPACREAGILVADRNFGCGSSREHAVWALTDFGIRCVIAPSFGDIFAGNARKNGLLLIRLPDATCARLRDEIALAQYAPVEVDLDAQQIRLASGEAIDFAIDPDDRRILMEGLDDIARTLRHADAIARFEAAL
ncbi:MULTISPECIES: 3-isopropylmalate dehydratase small subunit [unclassified Sphingopyxis]|uniref:3-isopropylmalate dehydratase small subunit n=1 Tax=unclassified Sphingopyxis TaxID=2614943 RepID=UPI00072FA787|nr:MULTISPECIES: 3-isopropylmalate dehydratase small subunit [unclassified Sphingopyxis]KTD99924.1 3-isopropylmalate dehydratase [Sphingopyxis sp. H012]KTE07109.1 3-isopropylmalate dehydratase [Sphingopyxis sp. H053]KTE09065.1 3-isopropylmalate dehydratase [Sphingopyxis sp. H093]KTE18452.1 3-isopropylmalate dehydratase [Sphingopyxis sp. H080]KTE36365.1 3-isopropylmalate dehydratase [Sphingopyxis sp. H038]